MKHLKRGVSALLILTLFLQIVPLNVFAQGTREAAMTEESTDAETGEQPFIETADEESDTQNDEVEEKAPVYVLYEEDALRQEAEKHFHLSDGSFLAVGYGNEVHYQDGDGTWQDIDNTLLLNFPNEQGNDRTETGADDAPWLDQPVYESVNGKQSRRFAASVNRDGYLFTTACGDLSVSLFAERNHNPEDAGEAESVSSATSNESTEATDDLAIPAEVCNPEEKVSTLSTEERRQLPLEEQFIPEKLCATVRYDDVWANTDLLYQTSGWDVKESIVVTEPMERYEYAFRLRLQGLTAKLEDNGSISLMQKNGDEVFRIPAPYMEDAAGVTSGEVRYTLADDGDAYLLTVCADPTWINDETRAWPITIDPTVEYNSSSMLYSSYVNSATPNVAPSDSATNFCCGYKPETGKTVGLIYVNTLPTLGRDCVVNEAYFKLKRRFCYGDDYPLRMFATNQNVPQYSEVGLHGLNWSNYEQNIDGKYKSFDLLDSGQTETALDFSQEPQQGGQYATFYITNLMHRWRRGDNAVSRLLVLDNQKNDTTTSQVVFWDVNSHNSNLYVIYRKVSGLEDNYGYHTQSIGRAGTGYVNNYTLRTTVDVPLISCPSTVMPFSLDLIYNENLSNEQADSRAKIGYGWKLSALQTISRINNTTYVYLDGDGTTHYFYSTGSLTTFTDEDGLGLTLHKESGTGNYTLTDQNENTWEFTDGYIFSFSTKEGNALYFAYEGNDYSTADTDWKPTENAHRLTSVWRKNNYLAAQKLVTLTYTIENATQETARLSSVTDMAGRVTTLEYDNQNNSKLLIGVMFPDGQEATYSYSAYSGYRRLEAATDQEAGYSISYVYPNSGLNVKKIEEYNLNSSNAWVLGERINCFLVDASEAAFRYYMPNELSEYPNGRYVTNHYFDAYGRTVNVVTRSANETEVLGVSSGTYTPNEETSRKNNRMTSAVSTGVQRICVLGNSGLEYSDNSCTLWSPKDNCCTCECVSSDGACTPHTGKRMMKLTPTVAGTCWAQQSVTLAANTTYVFSAYVNTANASFSGTDATYLAIYPSSGSNALTTGERINYATTTSIGGGWTRIQAVYQTGEQSGNYKLASVIEGQTGSVLFDDFQLEIISDISENEPAASTLNLIQFGSFEGASGESAPNSLAEIHWESVSSLPSNDFAIFTSGYFGNWGLHLGAATNDKFRVSQTVPIQKTANTSFVLSAWGQTPPMHFDDVADMEGNNSGNLHFFGVIAKLEYQSNAYDPEYFYLPFDSNISEWQYAQVSIVPKQAAEHPNAIVSQIKVSAALDYCPNNAYIDDISLSVEPVQTYAYDEDGKLIEASNTESNTATTYDSYGRVKSYTNLAGVTYNVVYNSSNTRKPKRITSDGVYTDYTYDSSKNVTQEKMQSSSGTKYLQSNNTYDTNRNFCTSSTDVNNITVTNTYNTQKGLLTKTQTPVNITVHQYNSDNDRPSMSYQSGVTGLRYDYDSKGQVSMLTHFGYIGTGNDRDTVREAYCFTYDEWGRETKIEVGSMLNPAQWQAPTNRTTLASKSYYANGNLAQMTYPNGNYVIYTYGLFDRLVKEVYYNSSNVIQADYRYSYNAEGALAKQYRVVHGSGGTETVVEAYTFEYDSLGRLIRSKETGSNQSIVQRTEHLYDTANRLSSQTWTIGSDSFTESRTYDADDGNLATMTAASGNTLTYQYDSLKRVTGITVTEDGYGFRFKETQSYLDVSGNRTSMQVFAHCYRGLGNDLLSGRRYAYDASGNIETITEVFLAGNTENTRDLSQYEYDDQNQLTKETRYTYTGTSQTPTTTTVVNYTYDTMGNLREVTDGTNAGKVTYTYGNSTWSDQLTGIQFGSNGSTHTISYSGGNPTTWYNGTFNFTDLGWTQGRRLSCAQYEDGNEQYQIEFQYDMSGIRTRKIADDGTHDYVTQNGKVVQERFGTNVLNFFYDASGRPFAVERSTNSGSTFTKFYYVLNLQGDVVGLLDENGTLVVKYSYDAWGKLLSVTDANGTAITSQTDIAHVNPLRYRGYYYDRETGFYYLQSRYYDPIVKRFLNSDAYASTGRGFLGYNMFAYCGNDPVNKSDDGGEFWHIVTGFVCGAVVGGIVKAVSNVVEGKNWTDGLGTAMLTGAASGALAASGVGLVASIAGNAAISMAGNAADQVIRNNGFDNFDVGDMLLDGAIGAVAGAAGGAGASRGNAKSAMSLGRQLTKRVIKGSGRAAFSYYSKNMMTTGGKSIYKELVKSLLKGGAAAIVGNVVKNRFA